MTPPHPHPNPRHPVATPGLQDAGDAALVPTLDDGLLSLQQRLDAIGRANDSASHGALSQAPAFANAVEARRVHLLLAKAVVLSVLLVALGLAAYLLWRSGEGTARGPATDSGEMHGAAISNTTDATLDTPGWPRLATLNELNRGAAPESLRLVVLRPQAALERADSPLTVRDWEQVETATGR